MHENSLMLKKNVKIFKLPLLEENSWCSEKYLSVCQLEINAGPKDRRLCIQESLVCLFACL